MPLIDSFIQKYGVLPTATKKLPEKSYICKKEQSLVSFKERRRAEQLGNLGNHRVVEASA